MTSLKNVCCLVVERWLGSLVWNEHLVDNMDHAIVTLDSHVDNLCWLVLASPHERVGCINGNLHRDFFSVEGLVGSAVASWSLLTCNDVVGEDGGELGDILEQGIDSASGKLGEGGVSWRKDSEWSLSLQGIN